MLDSLLQNVTATETQIATLMNGRISFLGPHTIVISYDLDPTIPGALYGQSHTCFWPPSFKYYIIKLGGGGGSRSLMILMMQGVVQNLGKPDDVIL